ncbi:DUF881 domain-containing protein [Caldibacillus lycopersici]|uniref:DUF881 domain-containing protein n=1 Tax=Perspicuibacillus lycopersici TaxID=1325689 RepID=A0AAE3IT10_9BACI|nr:DUF881 domain-containing protein [Perspicuibacillus lycopersici]MCU9612194.1 DUF881 domain-containing protein [Perspicuibacillus lycopersici]
MKKVTKKVKTRHVVLSLVFLVLGYLIAFSYELTKGDQEKINFNSREWERSIQLRNQLNELEESNRKLQNDLFEKQGKLLDIEDSITDEQQIYSNLANEAEELRMHLGKVKVSGEGVIVTLNDGLYDPANGDINNFMVHEHHVFNVINELYISGAEAVAINGQRLTKNSYIVCNGPVISVDGNQFPAPFVISAIGNKDTLEKALNIQGGVKDQLVNDNIIFQLEKKDVIEMDPVLSTGT